MNKVTRERNQQIINDFHRLYGTMPTMTLYATLAQQHEMSECGIRKLLYREQRKKKHY